VLFSLVAPLLKFKRRNKKREIALDRKRSAVFSVKFKRREEKREKLVSRVADSLFK